VWIVEWAALRPKSRTAINMDLGTWSTWTSVSHLPKIIFVSEPLNSIHRDAYDFVPNLFGFVVTLVNRDPQSIAIETEDLCD
jgi:hypothetical protein